jgi:hypothetical protein
MLENLRHASAPEEAISLLKGLPVEPDKHLTDELIGLLPRWLDHPAVIVEFEWVLVGQHDFCIEPLLAGVEEGTIPSCLALTVMSRIARRFPDTLSVALRKGGEAAKLAILALVGADSGTAIQTLVATWDHIGDHGRCLGLELICARQLSACSPLILRSLASRHPPLVLLALGWVEDLALLDMRDHLVPLLRDGDGPVVLAALSALTRLHASKVLGELRVVFRGGNPEIQKAVLTALASDPTDESLAFLADVARTEPPGSPVGITAWELLRKAVKGRVWTKPGPLQEPTDAVLFADHRGQCTVVLYNELGYRVTARGTLLTPSRRGPDERALFPADYTPDGQLDTGLSCRLPPPPKVRFRRPDGLTLVPQWTEDSGPGN